MVIKLFLEPSLDVGCTQVLKLFFDGVWDEDIG